MTIFDEITERKLLAGMLTETAVLARCDDIETADFTDCRHWVVFGAIRQLQSESADVGVLEVDELLRQRDKARDQFVSDSAGIWFLAELIIEQPPYRDGRTLIEHDVWWLRELSRRRRLLEAAA